MIASSALLYILTVPTFMMITLLATSICQVTLAQLEIPEAKPVETNGPNSINASETSNYLIFDDPGLGYSISYPNDWEAIAPGVEFGLSAFRGPDGSTITVKFIPTEDFNSDNIEELLEQAQEDSPQNVFTRNSTTTLGGVTCIH